MKPLDVLTKTLSSFGIGIDPQTLAILAVLAPILLGVAVVLYKRYKARKEAKKEGGAPSAPTLEAAADPASAPMGPAQLRGAWQRFVGQLPLNYGRSILNFEHFIVMGAAASGKSALIDACTDWRRQAKQFLESRADDKDLPIYLTSSAVVMELPARILHDHGAACRKALEQLWRPLYTSRSPTIVVTVDARRLKEDPPEAVAELGETIRGKINLLSAIRGRPLRVRVVLTHLDAADGYAELAAFYGAQGISARVPLPMRDEIGARLESWLEDARQHLPRALTSLDARQYRRVVSFLERAPELLPPIERFLSSLFMHEALSPDPIRAGLYLAAQPAAAPNPLARSSDHGPGPDPRLRHRIATAAVAGAVLFFLGASFLHQQARWRAANDALEPYSPVAENSKLERGRRASIVKFTEQNDDWLDTHPDFFKRPREAMRARLSEVIRRDLLLPRLREVAQRRGAPEGQAPSPYQRSLFLLALIHSDKYDELGILRERDEQGRNRLDIWSSMVDIDRELIVDYLHNTDKPLRDPVAFSLNARVDEHDTEAPWTRFIRDVNDAKRDRVVTVPELQKLQKRATSLEGKLVRLKHADITLSILPTIDKDGDRDENGERADDDDAWPLGLMHAYKPYLGQFLHDYEAFRNLDYEELAGMLKNVRDTGLAVSEEQGLLLGLINRLDSLYSGAQRSGNYGYLIVIAGTAYAFDELEWIDFVRNSKAGQIIATFVATDTSRSIFFPQGKDDFRKIVWNTAEGTKATISSRLPIEGRFTRATFESHVRSPVLKLRELLDDMAINHEDQRKLVEFVDAQVLRYAQDYRQQILNFVQGFELYAPSVEALRIALAQMSDDNGGTTFDDFLRIVEYNTTISTLNPSTRAEEPMLAGMKKVSDEFVSWRGVVNGDGATPKITQYKAILKQMLADLGSAKDSATPDGSEKTVAAAAVAPIDEAVKTDETLEQVLTAPGRFTLANLRGDKGSYSTLIKNWIAVSALPQHLQAPFLSPLELITDMGRADIKVVVGKVFHRDLLDDLARIVNLFPFDQAATEEMTPVELNELFHPVKGRVYDLFRRYFEPLSLSDGEGGFRMRADVQNTLSLPGGIHRIMNAVVRLSMTLWDEEGNPKPLIYKLATVALGNKNKGKDALTLAYLNVGGGSLFNFNQKPTAKTLEFDWTKMSNSQVGVQLTDTETKENSFPKPIVAESSYWSFLRLLRKARQPPDRVKRPPAAKLYTWEIPLERSKVPVQVVVKEDPWETFKRVKDAIVARDR